MPNRLGQLHRRLSLTPKILLVTLLVGSSVWFLSDYFATLTVKNSFKTHLTRMLQEKAVDYRYQFGSYVYAHRQAVKIFTSQKKLIDHLMMQNWPKDDEVEIKFHKRPPQWFANHSILRTFVTPRFAILLDRYGRAREVYQSGSAQAPSFLLAPSDRLLKQSTNQSFLFSRDGTRYLVASRPVADDPGQLLATLIVASPVDELFMIESQGASVQDIIVAIMDEESRKILTSSDLNLIPAGIKVEDLQDRYLVTVQEFFEYGNSEMDFRFVSFMALDKIAPVTEDVIRNDRLRRVIQASMFLVAFALVMVLLTRKIGDLTRHIEMFSREKLGSQNYEAGKGDQLVILEERFHRLMEEVLAAQETIRLETEAKTKHSAEIERKERQLRLLQLVTDAMGVGVMLETKEGFNRFNKHMRTLEGQVSNLSVFDIQQGLAEERPIEDKDGRKRIFRLISPAVQMDEKVILVSDITEQKEAADKIARGYEIQRVINSILKLGLEVRSFEEQLEHALDSALSLPWIEFQSKGAIFLAQDDTKNLSLAVHRGFEKEHQEKCRQVPFGKCVCGKAVEMKDIFFVNLCEGDHCLQAADIEPHGHYSVPIQSGEKVLGVMTLYLDPNHQKSKDEEDNLLAVARTLAILIERHNTEEQREKLQNQLTQALKMESVGRLAGGVAHDFNNILTAIVGYSELALLKLGKDDPLYDTLKTILDSGHKASMLTSQLLAFSRKQVLEMKAVDINEVINNMVKMLMRIIGEDIIFEYHAKTSISLIWADASQIEQILMNLAVNSRDAMPDGGNFTIETNEREIRAYQFQADKGLKPGSYVVLTVKDSGLGMAPDVVENIFEPFYTTKGLGEGTGLGLATIYGIVKQHQGHITVNSAPGKGTIFNIFLPVSQLAEPEKKPETSIIDMPSGSETILVVEDESQVRQLIEDSLVPLGYNVLGASEANEAQQVSKEYEGKIDLLLTDVVMPGLDGRKLADLLSAQRPDLKIIFMSGYSDNAISRHGVLNEGVIFIQKPISPAILAKKLREVLEED